MYLTEFTGSKGWFCIITSFTTFGNGISNYTAQNLGARIVSRVKEGFKVGVKIVWILCVPIVSVYVLANNFLIQVFMEKPSEIALLSGTQLLKIVPPFYYVISVKLVSDGILRGAGLMKQFMAATFTDLILRVVLTIILSRLFGYIGIWFSWPIGWCIATVLSVWFYRNGPWKDKTVCEEI